MKMCPQCHDEYRDDIALCLECHVQLEIIENGTAKVQRPKNQVEQIDLDTAVKVFEGSLDGCREIESLLKKERVGCLLVPDQGKYALCINEARLLDYTEIMKARFDEMVEREHSKDWKLQDVHLDGSDVTCPACGHVGALVEGKCADCELVLGVE